MILCVSSFVQNNETAAMSVYQTLTDPATGQIFSYVNTFFCSNQAAGHVSALIRSTRVVRAPDLKSVGTGFKPRSDC